MNARRFLILAVLASAPNFVVLDSVYAQAGDLDPTFGDGGKVVSDFPRAYPLDIDLPTPSVIQADGKVVVANEGYVERLNPDGSLDRSFGSDGEVYLGYTWNTMVMRLQTDGKIIVAGGNGDFILSRLMPDGSFDPTFGDGGTVSADFGATAGDEFGGESGDLISEVFVQADGRILAVGSIYNGLNLAGGIGVMAFRPDGKLDQGFGQSGKVFLTPDALGTLAPFYWPYYVYVVPVRAALETDGGIVIGSIATSDSDISNGYHYNDTVYFVRLNSDGSPDLSFGQSGVSTYVKDAYPFPELHSIATRPDGGIVSLAALNFGGWNNNPSLIAMNADGTFDTAFGVAGIATIDLSGFDDEPPSFDLLAVDGTGDITLAGTRVKYEWSSGSDIVRLYYNDMAALRLSPDASIDAGFGIDGIATVSLYEYQREVYARSLNLLDDGRIVMAGPIEHFPKGPTHFSTTDIAVVRLTADGSADAGFGTDGAALVSAHTHADNKAADIVLSQADGKIVVAGSGRTYPTIIDFELIRYNNDGSLDVSFGNQGRVSTDIRSINEAPTVPGGETARYEDLAYAMAMQPDGKILVAGESSLYNARYFPYSSYALARYDENGSLDPTFGLDGKVVTDIPFDSDLRPSAAYIMDIALQSDGKIVAAGTANNRPGGGPYEQEMAIVRYNPDGSPDTSFGDAGIVRINRFSRYDERARSVAVQPDGKIVVGGYMARHTILPPYDDRLMLARLNADGSFDATFGDAGIVTTDIGDDDQIFDIELRPDGKIVVGGSTGPRGDWDMAVARYLDDGNLDSSFGFNGYMTFNFGDGLSGVVPSGVDEILSLDLQADGRIVAAGYTGRYIENPVPREKHLYPYVLSYDFALMRLEEDGNLDYSFGYAGKTTTAFESDYNIGNSVAMQADGKILVVGETVHDKLFRDSNLPDYDVAIARYEGISTNLDQIEALVFRTQDLASAGVMSEGQANSLQSKLQAAAQQVDRGNYNAAVKQLQSFLSEVQALRSGAVISEYDANYLLTEGQSLITLLSN